MYLERQSQLIDHNLIELITLNRTQPASSEALDSLQCKNLLYLKTICGKYCGGPYVSMQLCAVKHVKHV